MCIAQLLFTLIAVLYLTALSFCQDEVDFMNRSSNKRINSESLDITSQETSSRWMHNREVQMLFQNSGTPNEGYNCCPTVTEMVEPTGGKNQNDMFVELYRDGSNGQRFYEHSCRPDIVDKPCLFTERRLRNQSRCEQQYSYTYALVRDTNVSLTESQENSSTPNKHRHSHQHFNPFHHNRFERGGSSWTLDYIRVRSGCSCIVYPKPRRRKPRKKPKKLKMDEGSGSVF